MMIQSDVVIMRYHSSIRTRSYHNTPYRMLYLFVILLSRSTVQSFQSNNNNNYNAAAIPFRLSNTLITFTRNHNTNNVLTRNNVPSVHQRQQRRALYYYDSTRRNQQYDYCYNKITTTTTTTTTTKRSSLNMVAVSSSSEEDDNNESKDEVSSSSSSSKLDQVLSQLTTGFPFFVVFAAILAIIQPKTLVWVNEGSIISTMLAAVMCGTGLTLEVSDFTSVLQTKLESIPLGVACQFIIMPITAFLVGRILLYPLHTAIGPELFLGLLLVGCSPGGTASNLVTLIAGANVALSVLLTSCSTMMAVFMTPFLVTSALSILKRTLPTATKAVVGAAKTVTSSKLAAAATTTAASAPIHVSGSALCIATAKVVLLPVITGMILRGKYPKLADTIGRFTPFASVLLVSLICGGVVAQNVQMLASTTNSVASSVLGNISASTFLPIILLAVIVLHSIGFAGGYFIPKLLYKQSETTSRTISIEVGMQNSALAIVLARSIGAHPLASLPGALSATAHSCIGSMLAAYWRYQNNKNKKNESC